jgi:hypothetical protein
MAANTFNKFQIVIYWSEDIRGPVVSEIIPPLEVSLLSVKISLNVDSSSDVVTHSETQESHCKPPSPFNMVEVPLLAHIIHRTSIGYPMVHFRFIRLL